MFSDAFFFLRGMNLLEFCQLILGLFDLKHLYDVHRWKFIHTMKNSSTYWSKFVQQLDVQFHEALHIAEKCSAFHSSCSVVVSMYTHCESKC